MRELRGRVRRKGRAKERRKEAGQRRSNMKAEAKTNPGKGLIK